MREVLKEKMTGNASIANPSNSHTLRPRTVGGGGAGGGTRGGGGGSKAGAGSNNAVDEFGNLKSQPRPTTTSLNNPNPNPSGIGTVPTKHRSSSRRIANLSFLDSNKGYGSSSKPSKPSTNHESSVRAGANNNGSSSFNFNLGTTSGGGSNTNNGGRSAAGSGTKTENGGSSGIGLRRAASASGAIKSSSASSLSSGSKRPLTSSVSAESMVGSSGSTSGTRGGGIGTVRNGSLSRSGSGKRQLMDVNAGARKGGRSSGSGSNFGTTGKTTRTASSSLSSTPSSSAATIGIAEPAPSTSNTRNPKSRNPIQSSSSSSSSASGDPSTSIPSSSAPSVSNPSSSSSSSRPSSSRSLLSTPRDHRNRPLPTIPDSPLTPLPEDEEETQRIELCPSDKDDNTVNRHNKERRLELDPDGDVEIGDPFQLSMPRSPSAPPALQSSLHTRSSKSTAVPTVTGRAPDETRMRRRRRGSSPSLSTSSADEGEGEDPDVSKTTSEGIGGNDDDGNDIGDGIKGVGMGRVRTRQMTSRMNKVTLEEEKDEEEDRGSRAKGKGKARAKDQGAEGTVMNKKEKRRREDPDQDPAPKQNQDLFNVPAMSTRASKRFRNNPPHTNANANTFLNVDDINDNETAKKGPGTERVRAGQGFLPESTALSSSDLPMDLEQEIEIQDIQMEARKASSSDVLALDAKAGKNDKVENEPPAQREVHGRRDRDKQHHHSRNQNVRGPIKGSTSGSIQQGAATDRRQDGSGQRIPPSSDMEEPVPRRQQGLENPSSTSHIINTTTVPSKESATSELPPLREGHPSASAVTVFGPNRQKTPEQEKSRSAHSSLEDDINMLPPSPKRPTTHSKPNAYSNPLQLERDQEKLRYHEDYRPFGENPIPDTVMKTASPARRTREERRTSMGMDDGESSSDDEIDMLSPRKKARIFGGDEMEEGAGDEEKDARKVQDIEMTRPGGTAGTALPVKKTITSSMKGKEKAIVDEALANTLADSTSGRKASSRAPSNSSRPTLRRLPGRPAVSGTTAVSATSRTGTKRPTGRNRLPSGTLETRAPSTSRLPSRSSNRGMPSAKAHSVSGQLPSDPMVSALRTQAGSQTSGVSTKAPITEEPVASSSTVGVSSRATSGQTAGGGKSMLPTKFSRAQEQKGDVQPSGIPRPSSSQGVPTTTTKPSNGGNGDISLSGMSKETAGNLNDLQAMLSKMGMQRRMGANSSFSFSGGGGRATTATEESTADNEILPKGLAGIKKSMSTGSFDNGPSRPSNSQGGQKGQISADYTNMGNSINEGEYQEYEVPLAGDASTTSVPGVGPGRSNFGGVAKKSFLPVVTSRNGNSHGSSRRGNTGFGASNTSSSRIHDEPGNRTCDATGDVSMVSLNSTAEELGEETRKNSDALKGVTAFVDVRTASGDEAGMMFVDMLKGRGAKVVARPTNRLTHIIYKGGRPNTLHKYRAHPEPKPFVVGIGWVIKSAEIDGRADEGDFLVEIGKEEGAKRRRSYEPKMLASLLGSASKNQSASRKRNASEIDPQTKESIERVRRKSQQYAPKVGSPLARRTVALSRSSDNGNNSSSDLSDNDSSDEDDQTVHLQKRLLPIRKNDKRMPPLDDDVKMADA